MSRQCSFHPARLALLATLFVTLPVAAQTCLEDGTCPTPLDDCAPLTPDIAVGSLPLAFVPAPNDQDGFFAFASDAAVTVDYAGTAVLTLGGDAEPASLSMVPETTMSLRASLQSPGDRVVLNGLEPGGNAGQSGHHRVALGDIREGISAAYSGQGRTLSLDFRIDSGQRDASVAARLGGNGLRLLAPEGARVPVISGERAMTLYVRAFSGTLKHPEPVPVEVRVEGERVIATPRLLRRRAEVNVSFELLHGSYTAAPAARTADGATVAVINTLSPVTGKRTPMAVRVGEQRITWSTWGDGGAAVVSDVDTDRGDTLVSVNRRGNIELVRLKSDMTLVSRVSLGGSGQDTGLALASHSDLIYVLARFDNPRFEARPMQSLRTQLPAVANTRRPPYITYLVALEHDRTDPVFAQPIDVPVDVEPTVWIDCEGVPVVGVEVLGGAMTCDLQAFSIPPRDNDFSNGFAENTGEWGHTLLQWKQFNASYHAAGAPATPPPPGDPLWTTVDFAPANAVGSSTPPAGTVLAPGLGAGHATVLNNIEADSNVFADGDPGGGWQFGNADDLAEIGIAVGLYADCCGSPVALAPNLAGTRQPMVALGVQYCIHGGVFSQINDLIMDWDDGLSWHPDNNPMDYVDQMWATQYGNSFLSDDYFEVTELYVSHWDGGSFNQNQTLADPDLGALFSPLFPGQTVATDYIGDPPEELDDAAAIAEELTARMRRKGVRRLNVESTTWRDGQPVARDVRERKIPAHRYAGAQRN
ncbi:MAG: hypothetical protein AB8G16_12000 [Gammaproteobacteria bacterium]